MRNDSIRKKRIKALIIFAAVLFLAAALISALSTYKVKRSNEKLSEVDIYSMHEYSAKNSESVMKALASGKAEKLAAIVDDEEGAKAVTEFAEWKKADFDKAVSLGSGSLMESATKKGKMEVSERFFVDADGKKYVLFIETQTSRWGRENDGVSAVAVTTFEHFDELDYAWNGEADEESALAGKLLWNK